MGEHEGRHLEFGRLRPDARRVGVIVEDELQVWWSLWVIRDNADWSFFKYLLLILPFLTLSLIAYLLTPPLNDDDADIKKHYWDNARWMFSLAAFYLCVGMAFSFVIVGEEIMALRNTIRISGLLLMLSLAIWLNEKFHAVAAFIGGGLLISWIVLTMFSL